MSCRAGRAARPRKHRIRDMSLRMSFMMYMLVFSVLALILMGLTGSYLSNQQYGIYSAYAYRPDSADVGAGPSPGEGTQADGPYGLQAMPEDVRQRYNTYGMLSTLMIPLWTFVCLIAASFLFYHKKLQRPIALLREGSAQIARDSLDFHLEYARGDEMGGLVRSFEKMRGSLYESQRSTWRQMEERKRMHAAFSHDMRTPLTVLHGYTDMLRARLPSGDLPAEQVDHTLLAMDKQLSCLDRYVESMQTLQRLEDVSYAPVAVDGPALVTEMHQSARMLCEAAGKALAFSSTLRAEVLHVDPAIVLRVVDNLLSNAVRYAQDAVGVEIDAVADTFSVLVTDDGHGFSPESLDRAKEPFYTSSAQNDTHFGLGLNICDVLCAKHGGYLSLGNRREGGARIIALFSMPPQGT